MFDLYSTKRFLIIEFTSLFLLLPILLFFLTPVPVLPFLWLVTLWCIFILKKEGRFSNKSFISFQNVNKYFKRIFLQFFVVTTIFIFFIFYFIPEKIFSLVIENPLFWLFVIVIYPLLSAYPQEIVYRMFFFYRYGKILKNRNIFIFINAFLFAYMHILFHNWIAVVLTFFGGIIFAKLYEKTNSLIIVSISHSLYGCMIFTIGLGEYFYTGTILTISEVFKI